MKKYRRLSFMKFPDYRVGKDGSVWTRKVPGQGNYKGKWKKLKPGYRKGYRFVVLTNKHGKSYFSVHHLVLLAYKGEPKSGQEGCHYPDSDPSNNRVENLSWGSKKKNTKHREIHRTNVPGEKNGNAVVSNKQARKIRRLYALKIETSLGPKRKYTQVQLGNRFDLSQTAISRILRRETYSSA